MKKETGRVPSRFLRGCTDRFTQPKVQNGQGNPPRHFFDKDCSYYRAARSAVVLVRPLHNNTSKEYESETNGATRRERR